ncbi:hypothetical protein OSCT_2178 [Oscillochloris trichoides DG-6]|uniref:Uncharacterized protein n=1 Tax=Oscillochloris trichoides DG-6 TaxID=765420 RepID=E1IFS7_9CHLR|nr:hypothetical protein [Oscillochloris trichoides]EFO79968.1 hypothetical protein OSCT_2178 [Oscillochloris trichoides DG-6]
MYQQLLDELAGYTGEGGVTPSDLLSLPDGLRRLLTWLTRHGNVGVEDLCHEVGCEQEQAQNVADTLIARGLLVAEEHAGQVRYSVRMARVRTRGRTPDRLKNLFD